MTTGQVFRGTLIILLTLIAAYMVIMSIHIIIVLFIAIIIASAVRPAITGLTRRHVPPALAIVSVYLTIAVVIVTLLVAVFPPVVNQVAQYLDNEGRLAYRIITAQRWVEATISDVTQNEVSLVAPEEIRSAVTSFVGQIRRAMPSMLDDIGTTLGDAILIFVMGAYWLTSHERATSFISQISPPRYRTTVGLAVEEIESTLGGYVRGMALISLIVGLLNFVAMQLLGVPNAVTLAFIIAITTTIPMIGGLIGVVLALLLTLVVAPQYVIVVIVIAFIVQQIEAYVLGPRIMSNSVGLDPLLVIVYTAIGFVMFGIVGALIAVPIMGAIHILVTRFIITPYQESIRQFQMEQGLPVLTVDTASAIRAPRPENEAASK